MPKAPSQTPCTAINTATDLLKVQQLAFKFRVPFGISVTLSPSRRDSFRALILKKPIFPGLPTLSLCIVYSFIMPGAPHWTEAEEKRLLAAAEKMEPRGADDWDAIARKFPGRNGSACSQKWRRLIDSPDRSVEQKRSYNDYKSSPSTPPPAKAPVKNEAYIKPNIYETPLSHYAKPAEDVKPVFKPIIKPSPSTPSTPSKFPATNEDENVIYIIRHSNPTLQFEPSSATLIKVGKTTWSNLASRLGVIVSKAYKEIPELYVQIPRTVAGVRRIQTTGRFSFDDLEGASSDIRDVVAVIPCQCDPKEAITFESEVRQRIGGSLNDAMAKQLKEIVKLPNNENYDVKDIHSYETVVSDLNLLDYIREAWIDGRLRTPAQFCALVPPNYSFLQEATEVSFCISISPGGPHANSGYEPTGRRDLKLPYFTRLSDLPEYTYFCSHVPKYYEQPKLKKYASIIDYQGNGDRGRHSALKFHTFFVTGQVRSWPQFVKSITKVETPATASYYVVKTLDDEFSKYASRAPS